MSIDIPTQPQASITTFTPINVDDIPIKPKNMSPEKEEHASFEGTQELNASTHASIEVPKYDFEEILQKALEEQGIDVVAEPETPKPKVQKKAKSKFLKRKKRYDPREAIKKEKQQAKNKKKRNSKFYYPSYDL